jgi:hypothetical protein
MEGNMAGKRTHLPSKEAFLSLVGLIQVFLTESCTQYVGFAANGTG